LKQLPRKTIYKFFFMLQPHAPRTEGDVGGWAAFAQSADGLKGHCLALGVPDGELCECIPTLSAEEDKAEWRDKLPGPDCRLPGVIAHKPTFNEKGLRVH